jgi:hypothetical protein
MTLSTLVSWLQGKKSYIIAALTALDGLYQYYVQHGSNWHTLALYLLFGGGLAALRAGITNSVNAAVAKLGK